MTDKGAKPMYVDPPFIEGATGAAEATAYEPELVAALESGIKLDAINRDRLNKCKAELLARGVKIDARASWVMGFHWKGDGRTVRLARIITVDELWPTFFDEAAKQCWIDAFAGAAFESTLLIDRVIETGFCVYSDELEGDKE